MQCCAVGYTLFYTLHECYCFPVCAPDDLTVPLPSDESWSDILMTEDGQGVFTFSGIRRNVTFNGISYGSAALYTTTGDFCVKGEAEFPENLSE